MKNGLAIWHYRRTRRHIMPLKSEARFGYLLDIGHMFIRLRGENTSGATLFTNSQEECPKCAAPGFQFKCAGEEADTRILATFET